MQLLITHRSMARTRVLQFGRWQLLLAVSLLALVLMALSGTIYHVVFLKAAREGWPVVSPLVRLIVRDEIAQRERFMRDNLDAMAQRVGEMQAKLVRLEAMGERVSGLAGLPGAAAAGAPAASAAAGTRPGRGGPFIPVALPRESLGIDGLQAWMTGLDEAADFHTDLFTFIESRLLEDRLRQLMIPSAAPLDGPVGSGFGFRPDPFNGRSALHTGLDFPADPGTTIHAAAGGIVVAAEWHAEYGHMLEIDHGNGLLTRYAHCAAIDVALGALVKRGQPVARVGNSGRSTGPHLHFEVLLGGVPQDPARFLAGAPAPAPQQVSRRRGG